MAENDRVERELSARQRRAIAALLEAPSIRHAATTAAVGERTLRRWLKMTHFAKALEAASSEVVRYANLRVQSATTDAVETLRTAS